MVCPATPLFLTLKKGYGAFLVAIAFLMVYCPVLADSTISAGQRVYGIASGKKNMDNGTTQEHVIIYPQERHDSMQTIARNGLLVRHKDATATVLVCHGFMCDMHDAGMLTRGMFKKSNYNVLTFNFRAHGRDHEGQYCTFGRDEALDVIAAAKFIRNHPELKEMPLFVYGFSMGAVSAIEAQALDSTLFDGMILDCPFESSEKVIRSGLEGLKFSLLGYEFEFPGRNFLEQHAFHPYVQSLVKTILSLVSQMDASKVRTNFCPVHPGESVKKITVPCFFIHCKNDTKVGLDQVRAVYEGAGGYKKLWLTHGRWHCDSGVYNPRRYAQHVRAFLKSLLNNEYQQEPQEEIIEDTDDDDVYTVA